MFVLILKIEYLNINDLKPYEKNAKIHTEEQIKQIEKSIKDFGMVDPLGLWGSDNVVMIGNGRLFACKNLGITEIPCIRLDHLSDEERKAYALAHNKLTMNTDFDFDLLQEELDALLDFDMSEFGFKEIEREFNHIDDLLEDGFGLDEQVKESDIFGITFNFPIEHREVIDRAIKDKTKQYFVDLILDEVLNNGD